jgi:hypothetical protein
LRLIVAVRMAAPYTEVGARCNVCRHT